MAFYKNKIILGPMVGVCTLPLRLLALRYGADLVYTDEIVDKGLVRSRKIVNAYLNTVDFVNRSGKVIYRTTKEEKARVIIQLGASEPERALATAKLVENHVSAVDINMGCPKEFSVDFGMGAALLDTPETAYNIISTLVRNLTVPVTCKIRILSSKEKTLDFVKGLIASGVSAIAIHGRTRQEGRNNQDHPDYIKYVAEKVSVPIIANGASQRIKEYNDIFRFKEQTSASSIMLSRAAKRNCSIFRKEGLIHHDEVIREFLKLAIEYDTERRAKYIVTNMYKHLMTTPRGLKLLKTETFQELCEMWGLGEYYSEHRAKRPQGYFKDLLKTEFGDSDVIPEPDITEKEIKFRLEDHRETRLPKSRLELWLRKNGMRAPTYRIIQEKNKFRAVVTLDKQQAFSSSCWDSNKLFAEHAAALVCLKSLYLE